MEKGTDRILVGNDGEMFEGTRDMFRDCFFDNATDEQIIDWCDKSLDDERYIITHEDGTVLTNIGNTEPIDNADQLENKIAKLQCQLTYEEIVEVALMTAEEVKSNVPMYDGELNPKWKLWDDTIKALKTRI